MSETHFIQDYAVPPGKTLKETLEEIGISQEELAERTGTSKKTIARIISGRASITPERALQLENILGIPATFWNNLERNYREALVRMKNSGQSNPKISPPVGQASANKASCRTGVPPVKT